MQLIKWNPTRDLFSLGNHMNSLFDDFFYPARKPADVQDLRGEGFESWVLDLDDDASIAKALDQVLEATHGAAGDGENQDVVVCDH